MALQIGQVVQGVALYPARRGAGQGGEAANEPALPRSGQDAPPLTGVGGKALSGPALQALQGEATDEGAAVPGQELSDEQKEQVKKLKARDQEVRRHEAAHAAAGGQYAGAPTFSYEQGPDGQRYAVGGEVSIDTSPVDGDPEATARKADQIRRAALAPADPSSQDQAVAAAATKMKAQAQAQAAQERQAEASGEGEGAAPTEPQVRPAPPGVPGSNDEAAEGKVAIAGPKFGAEAEGEEAGAARRRSEAAEAYGRSNVNAFGTGDDRRKSETSGLSLVA
jgi:hypothetical protein